MPKFITINIPSKHILEKNCIHRITKNKSFRMYEDEYKEIFDICEDLGISHNYYVRCCCILVARAIKKELKRERKNGI